MAGKDRFFSPIGIGLLRDKDGNFKGNPSAYEIEVDRLLGLKAAAKTHEEFVKANDAYWEFVENNKPDE